jgi:hypothetical protein
MPDINDPIFEFLRDDPIFMMDLYGYDDLGPEPTIGARDPDEAVGPRKAGRSAARLAATDNLGRGHQTNPAAPAARDNRQRRSRSATADGEMLTAVLGSPAKTSRPAASNQRSSRRRG